MSEVKKLTKRQLAVLEDLFTGESDEQEVLERHAVPHPRYEKWLADERFTSEIEQRIACAYIQSRMILARRASAAAKRLVALASKGEGETTRKACLDILSLQDLTGRKASSDASLANKTPTPAPDLSPETASRFLAVLAAQT